jgi:hypothetical protein
MTASTDYVPEEQWLATSRVEAWAGEIRVNLIRLVAIALFYARHLIEYSMATKDAPVRGRYHVAVTVIVLAWAFEAIVLHVMLSRRHYTEAVKYFAVIWDALMITGLCVAAGGPKSPLVVLYFALIATAPLRLDLRLVYAATAAAMLGYLFLLGYYAWYVIGRERYYSTPELRIPRSTEVIYLLALLVCGLLAGQLVRQIRRMVMHSVVVQSSENA